VAKEEANRQFEVLGAIRGAETFAAGNGIRELARLRKTYGDGRWRKRKWVAGVQLRSGRIRTVERHWYEAAGIGKREMKIKRFLD
jgi:hypothetical protein